MALPQSANREKLHHRKIDCEGFRRGDGLWDIEAHLVDTRSYDCGYDADHRGGMIKAGEPVHDMWLRLTLDLDFTIHDAVASSDATPFPVCPRACAAMQKLIGIRIGSGWMKEVRSKIGSDISCTHLMDLLGPLSATAYQTLHAALEEREKAKSARSKPKILDTCIALASDGDVVKDRWPEFYQGKS